MRCLAVLAALLAGSLVVLILSIPAAAQEPETALPDPEFDLNEMRLRTVTQTQEMRIGRQLTRRFERRVKLLENAPVQEYVDRIAQKLASNSEATVPITTKIVDSGEVNAVSFPGGFLYVNSGLILALDDEAEIASVLAHEIAHVVARDGMRNNRYFGTGGGGREFILIPSTGSADGELDGFLTPLVSLGSPREIQADYRAIQYMQKAGYDPNALIRFLERLQSRETSERRNILPMFQTHPPATERIRLAQEEISAIPPPDSAHADTTAELQTIKQILTEREAARPRPEY